MDKGSNSNSFEIRSAFRIPDYGTKTSTIDSLKSYEVEKYAEACFRKGFQAGWRQHSDLVDSALDAGKKHRLAAGL